MKCRLAMSIPGKEIQSFRNGLLIKRRKAVIKGGEGFGMAKAEKHYSDPAIAS